MSNNQNKIFGRIMYNSNEGVNKFSFKNYYFNQVIDRMTEYDIKDITGLTLKDIMALDYAKYEILIQKMKTIKEKTAALVDAQNETKGVKKDIKKYDKKLKKIKGK